LITFIVIIFILKKRSSKQKCVYIPIGSDCSVAYQLQKLKLRLSALPFDWIRSNNLNNIIEAINDIVLNNIKFHFLNIDVEFQDCEKFIEIKNEYGDTEKFNGFRISNKYGFVFPHDKPENFIVKYEGRIDRFCKIMRDKNIKKIFVRVSKKKEDFTVFSETIKKICNNFTVISYVYGDTKFSSWRKDEIDWSKLLV